MILLVSGATKTLARFHDNPYLGVLLTPNDWRRLPHPGTVWAADNAAFSNFNPNSYRSMLRRIERRNDCLWVAVPDVVGDHHATIDHWQFWSPVVRAAGHLPAFVCQDGCTPSRVPWDPEGMAIFIGGSTKYKLSAKAADIVREANQRHIWTHMGRVNTIRRIKYAHTLGCRSFDGTQHSMFPDTHIPSTLQYLRQLDRQSQLPTPEPASN